MKKFPSITSFSAALDTAGTSFRTLRGFRVVRADGRPAISRTAMFAEAQIWLDGSRRLLCVRLSHDEEESFQRAMHILRHIDCGAFPRCEILHDELVFVDSAGRESCCDVLLTDYPEGETLGEAVHYADTGRILSALHLLRDEFLRAGVAHRNLKPSNLIWSSDGHLYPVRCHYLCRASREDIEAEFADVERYLLSSSRAPLSDAVPAAEPYRTALGDMWDEVSAMHDMMRRVRRGNLYGYVDDCGRTVIEPRYTSAGDFSENRAVAGTPEGMGIIDRTGRYVVEPVYDIADFDPDRGGYVARRGDVWHVFDYMGRTVRSGSYEEVFIKG